MSTIATQVQQIIRKLGHQGYELLQPSPANSTNSTTTAAIAREQRAASCPAVPSSTEQCSTSQQQQTQQQQGGRDGSGGAAEGAVVAAIAVVTELLEKTMASHHLPDALVRDLIQVAATSAAVACACQAAAAPAPAPVAAPPAMFALRPVSASPYAVGSLAPQPPDVLTHSSSKRSSMDSPLSTRFSMEQRPQVAASGSVAGPAPGQGPSSSSCLSPQGSRLQRRVSQTILLPSTQLAQQTNNLVNRCPRQPAAPISIYAGVCDWSNTWEDSDGSESGSDEEYFCDSPPSPSSGHAVHSPTQQNPNSQLGTWSGSTSGHAPRALTPMTAGQGPPSTGAVGTAAGAAGAAFASLPPITGASGASPAPKGVAALKRLPGRSASMTTLINVTPGGLVTQPNGPVPRVESLQAVQLAPQPTLPRPASVTTPGAMGTSGGTGVGSAASAEVSSPRKVSFSPVAPSNPQVPLSAASMSSYRKRTSRYKAVRHLDDAVLSAQLYSM